MAKYQRQATNKYYGAGNAGYVSTGSATDGLAKALTNAGYKVGKAEELRIDRKKDKAIAKIDEMVANGKSFETIQAEIIKGDHPELTGKYIDATTNYHAGRVKAEEVKNNIVAAQNNGEYDITDESSNLDMFFKKFMPDTKSMDSATLLGFTTSFNQFRATAVTQDAENRAAQAIVKKNEEGISILDGIETSQLKTRLPEFIKSLQIPLPNRDGSNKSNLLYTNEETMNVLKNSVKFLIADAKTEDDLDRVDILLNTNLGYSKNGSAIGTLASRKSDEMNAIKKDLERTRRTLISNDREEENRASADRIKELTTKMLVNKVEVTDENGNVTTRKMNFKEKQALLDEIRKEGDMQLVASFAKSMSANPYYDNDPEVFNNLLVKIREDQVQDRADIAKLINDNNIAPDKQAKLYEAYDNSLLDDNKQLHLVNTSYVMGTQAIENKLAEVLEMQKEQYPNLLRVATDSVRSHLIVEIYDFEKDYYEEAVASGKKKVKPDNTERAKFMQRKLEDIALQYQNADKVIQLKTFDQQEAERIKSEEKAKEAEANKSAEEKLKDEANEATRQATGFYETFNSIVAAVPNIEIDVPVFEEFINKTGARGVKNSMTEETFNETKVLPVLEKAISSIIPEGLFTEEFMSLIPQKQYDDMTANLSEQLNVSVEQIEQSIFNIMNKPVVKKRTKKRGQ